MEVHIHANCQAIPIGRILQEVHPDWNITWFEAHSADIIRNLQEHKHRIKTADLVLCQPIHDGYRNQPELSTNWVRENIATHSTFFIIPALHFLGHHPGLDGIPLPNMFVVTSLLAAHLAACGIPPHQAAELLLSPNFLSKEEIEVEITAWINELRRREDADHIDIQMSSFLDQNARSRPLFHIQNHPFRETIAQMINEILTRIGSPAMAALTGTDYQPVPHVPPLPCIANYLRANGGRFPDEPVRMPGHEPMTEFNFYHTMIQNLQNIPSEEIWAAMSRCTPALPTLRRLAATSTTIPGLDRWRSFH